MGIRFLIKVLISGIIIAAVSELGRRYSLIAAILASLPLTSVLALTWLYLDTGNPQKVSELSIGILWAVLPSLLLFAVLPLLLKTGMRFAIAMPLACLMMFVGYTVYAGVLRKFGFPL